MRHSKPPDRIQNMIEFRSCRFQKFQARRRGIKEIPHLDGGPGHMGRGLCLKFGPAFDPEGPGIGRLFLTAGDGQSAYRGNRW